MSQAPANAGGRGQHRIQNSSVRSVFTISATRLKARDTLNSRARR